MLRADQSEQYVPCGYGDWLRGGHLTYEGDRKAVRSLLGLLRCRQLPFPSELEFGMKWEYS